MKRKIEEIKNTVNVFAKTVNTMLQEQNKYQ